MMSRAKSFFSSTLLPVVCLLIARGTTHSLQGQNSIYNTTSPWGLVPVSGDRFISGPDGTLYFASYWKDSIFKLTPDGTLTTLAGGGTHSGYIDGAGDVARFNGPKDLAWDPQGNLFVLDSGNGAIRKVTPAGLVSTFVGGIGSGYVEGNQALAKFSAINSIASDKTGNLYIVDSGNLAVRQVTPDGNVSTLCKGVQDSQGVADFSPQQVAVGPNDEVYVLALNQPTIWKVESNGTRTVVIGPAGFGSIFLGSALTGLRIDRNGDFFIASVYFGAGEWKIPRNGGTVTSLGDGFDVTFDNSGNFYLLGSPLKKFAPNGTVTELAGLTSGFVDGRGRTARFNTPAGMVRDRQGNLFVADSGNNAIRKITLDGTVTTFAGGTQGFADGNGATAKFNTPYGLAIDKADNIYVADWDNNAVRMISPAGEVTTLAGKDGTAGLADGPLATAKFHQPYCLAIDPGGAIYVADHGNYRLRRIAAGQVTTINLGYYDNGRFFPYFVAGGMIFNSAGELFYSPSDDIQKLSGLPNNPVQTAFAGYGWDYGLVDGVGAAAWFSHPTAMVMDAQENIYVADTYNNAIRKITPDAIVTTLAGNGDPGFADGYGVRANFHSPGGIALGDHNEIYVSDATNNTIRILTPPGPPQFAIQPSNQVSLGGTMTFTAFAIGNPSPTYQWYKNGSAISGATTASYSISHPTTADKASYLVVATNFAGSVNSNSVMLTVIPIGVTLGDFDGDGKADFVWTNTETGERSMWLLDGNTIKAGASLGVVPIAWVVSATADFDGDGKADLFWTNTLTGDRTIWLMNGSTKRTNTFMGTVPTDWVISGTGDFNGDGKADLVWTNTVTGDRAMWLMNGNTVLGGGYLGTVPVDWAISGVGDFNGDGKADLVWSNTVTGEHSMWFQNGSATISGATLNPVPAAWVISGVGDFNGDGKADIFLTNTVTGDRAMWLMIGSTVMTNTFMGTVPADWVINATGDFNGDGNKDLVWTNTASGDRAIWLLKGNTVAGGGYLGTIPIQWKID